MYQAKHKSVGLALSVVTVLDGLLKVSVDSIPSQTSVSIKFEDLRSHVICKVIFGCVLPVGFFNLV